MRSILDEETRQAHWPALTASWSARSLALALVALALLVLFQYVGAQAAQVRPLGPRHVPSPTPTAAGFPPTAQTADAVTLPISAPPSLEKDCFAGTGWTWTFGPFQPELAARVQADLDSRGLETTVEARQFGETDSCGSFATYAVDYSLTVGKPVPVNEVEQRNVASSIYKVLQQHTKPRVGKVTLTFATTDDRLVLYAPPDSTPEPLAAAPQAAEQDGFHRRVYVVVYDPMLSNGQLLHEYMGWFDHEYLTEGTINLFANASNGYVQYEVVATSVVTDEWPVKIDGFRYTEEEYLAMLSGEVPAHEPEDVDYNAILNDPDLDPCGRLNRGEIDDLWVYSAPGFGFWESTLAGPGGYWYNSAPVPDLNSCRRLMPIMGPSYERDLDCAVHNFSHRTESTMVQVYGSWEQNRTLHNWDRFGLVLALSPDYWYSGCGSGHYPPNGQSDYDYANPSTAPTTCYDFANYPDLGDPEDTVQDVTCSAWNCDHTTYMGWWHSHLPPNPACGSDNVANNWWNYFAEPAHANHPLTGCELPNLIITGPMYGEVNMAHTFAASLWTITGASPVTFTWDATGQAQVTHESGIFHDEVSFTWTSTGNKTISVVATYPGGEEVSSFPVVVVPSPVPFVRVSTGDGPDLDTALTRTSSGRLVAAWDRSNAGTIWQASSLDGGETWSSQAQVAWGWHPTLLAAQDGRLWLAYHRSGEIWARTSSDEGTNWSAEVNLTGSSVDDQGPALAQTDDGALWLVWARANEEETLIWFMRSENNGTSWLPAQALPMSPAWCTDPKVTQGADGKVWIVWFQAYDFQYSTSTDDGATWTTPTSFGLGGHSPLLRAGTDGKLWFSWGDLYWSDGTWRTHLAYKTSSDNGATWTEPQDYTVFNGDNFDADMAALPDGRVAFAWCSNRTGANNIWFGSPGTHADLVVPPAVMPLEHSPSSPDSSQEVTFTAAIADVTAVSSAQLRLTVDGVQQDDQPIYDDGVAPDATAADGVYTGSGGPFAPGAHVVYQFGATNSGGLSALTPPDRSFDVLGCYALTMIASPTAGGTISANPAPNCNSGTGYTSGTVVELTASANANYSFSHWSGDCSGADACQVTMDADKTVTANFVASSVSGDVNSDDLVDSTDALIVLSADAGIDTSQFCPMNCGDVNADGLVDSTDALIILSYDAGMSVPFPVGTGACPSTVTQPPGCSP